MKKLLTRLAVLSAAAALGIGAVGCTPTTGPTTTSNGGPATALMVNSLANNSIGAMWTRDTGDHGTDTLVGTPANGGAIQTVVAASGGSAATLPGLTAGVTYTIAVHAPGGVSQSIVWAPAARSQMVRLYETSDPTSGDPSGLSLLVGAVAAYPTSVSAGDQTKIDMVLATDATVAGSNLSFLSAGVTGSGIAPGLSGLRSTMFNDNTVNVVGGLDADYYSSNFSTLFGSMLNSYDIPSNNDTHDAIIRVMTVDKYYARVDIMRQSNGSLYGTNAAGYKYIDVMVSEQSLPNLPYADRGIDVRHFTSQKRSAGSYNAN